jgi:hypothetical protein
MAPGPYETFDVGRGPNDEISSASDARYSGQGNDAQSGDTEPKLVTVVIHSSNRRPSDPAAEQPPTAPTKTNDAQDGVKAIEAISLSWTKTSLYIAYARCVFHSVQKRPIISSLCSLLTSAFDFSIFLMAFVTSLEAQVTLAIYPRATRFFQKAFILSRIPVARDIINGQFRTLLSISHSTESE